MSIKIFLIIIILGCKNGSNDSLKTRLLEGFYFQCRQ